MSAGIVTLHASGHAASSLGWTDPWAKGDNFALRLFVLCSLKETGTL